MGLIKILQGENQKFKNQITNKFQKQNFKLRDIHISDNRSLSLVINTS